MWALKYRPKTFDEVVGQEKAIKILKGSVGNSNVFILHGGSGVGKTTVARIFADHINGEAIEINGSSNNGVDDVRGLIASASYQPAFFDYKVFIIDECHMFSSSAWNAMLKILEETPKTTLWMLCTTEVHKIPQTIRTRATMVPFVHLPTKVITDHLQTILTKEGCSVSDKDIETLALYAEGSVRNAITSLETYVNTQELPHMLSTIKIIELLACVFMGNFSGLRDRCEGLTNDDVHQIIHFVSNYLQLILLRTELPKVITTEEIMDKYTDINSIYIDDLRNLQLWVSRSARSGQDDVRENFRLMYALFTELMKHYNDFRDNKDSIFIVLMNHMVEMKYD